VQRPWGCYEDIDAGDRFRVKRMYQRVKEPAK
jgi:mannose-6-phosphate isomerase-like protein (cupin superfamily)